MIWHIFKKDFKLLWPYAAMLAALQIINNIILVLNPIFDGYVDDSGYSRPGSLQTIMLVSILLGGAFLISLLVHQDAVPGVRQDWLIRPISRMQLLMSKILSVILLIHVPMLIGDLLYAFASGFPAGVALSHAIARNILVFMMASIPLLAFASLTRNLMEGVVGVFAMALSLGLFATGEYGAPTPTGADNRSEERRVGKECRSRWSPYH